MFSMVEKEQRAIFYKQLAIRRKPKGFCNYCNLAIAAQAPSEEEGNIIFHAHCWDEYNRLKQAKKELFALVSILTICKINHCEEEIKRIHTIEQAKRFLFLLVDKIKKAANRIKKKAIHLIQELKQRIETVANLLRLEGLELVFNL
jgi:hypothetical protein